MASFVYLCVIVSSIVLAVSVGLANGKGQYVRPQSFILTVCPQSVHPTCRLCKSATVISSLSFPLPKRQLGGQSCVACASCFRGIVWIYPKRNDSALSKIVNRMSLMRENLLFPVLFLVSGQIYHENRSQGNVRTALSNRWHWGRSRVLWRWLRGLSIFAYVVHDLGRGFLLVWDVLFS